MVDDVKQDAPPQTPLAQTPAPPAPPQGPRRLRLAVRSDGTPGGTQLVDADSGEPLAFEGGCHAEVRGDPKQGGRASVRLTFDGLEVDARAAQAPFHLVGATLGHAPPPAGTALGLPTPGAALGLPTPGVAAGGPGQAPTTPLEFFLRHNEALNEQQPRRTGPRP
jgi:hypothetical protein